MTSAEVQTRIFCVQANPCNVTVDLATSARKRKCHHHEAGECLRHGERSRGYVQNGQRVG